MSLVKAAQMALADAAAETPPPCTDAPEFTADTLTPDDLEWCKSVCRVCPLLALCDEYATRARVPVGVWAGRQRKGRGYSDREATA